MLEPDAENRCLEINLLRWAARTPERLPPVLALRHCPLCGQGVCVIYNGDGAQIDCWHCHRILATWTPGMGGWFVQDVQMKKHRLFSLVRLEDETGVSGVGVVADGCVFPDGQVYMVWRGDLSSEGHYKSIQDLVKIHGHAGRTFVQWLPL